MKIRGQKIYSHKERLLRKSTKVENGCIEWRGYTRNGYGKLMIGSRALGNRQTVMAHRLSYEVFKGDIPSGLLVCHKCDNRKCINPDHLFLGTHKDNTNDMMNKSRNVFFPRGGEKHHNSKLTWPDVKKIREIHGNNQREIADLFGVSCRTISDILRNKTWKPPTK